MNEGREYTPEEVLKAAAQITTDNSSSEGGNTAALKDSFSGITELVGGDLSHPNWEFLQILSTEAREKLRRIAVEFASSYIYGASGGSFLERLEVVLERQNDPASDVEKLREELTFLKELLNALVDIKDQLNIQAFDPETTYGELENAVVQKDLENILAEIHLGEADILHAEAGIPIEWLRNKITSLEIINQIGKLKLTEEQRVRLEQDLNKLLIEYKTIQPGETWENLGGGVQDSSSKEKQKYERSAEDDSQRLFNSTRENIRRILK